MCLCARVQNVLLMHIIRFCPFIFLHETQGLEIKMSETPS